jgi:hypothetical protein
MTSKRVLDHVHAAVAATVDGRSVIWDVALDLEVVLLPGQFAASDDAAIEHEGNAGSVSRLPDKPI